MKNMASNEIAYALDLAVEEFTGTAAGHLPVVDCEFCHERAAAFNVAFPLIKAEDFPDCTKKLDLDKFEPHVFTWLQFEQVIHRARELYGDSSLELVPNSALGPIRIEPIGHWPNIINDINIASPGGVMFSKSLIEQLRQREIEVPFQPAILKDRKRQEYPFAILQPRVYRILHKRTFKINPAYSQCQRCGATKVSNYRIPGPKQICLQSSFRGRTSHVFRVLGFESVEFVSDTLKHALDEIRPSGLAWMEFGLWVE